MIDGAKVHKHAKAMERLDGWCHMGEHYIDPVNLWDIRDDLIPASEIAELLLKQPEYFVAVMRDVISNDGPEIVFFRKEESMSNFVTQFTADMLEGRFKDIREFIEILEKDEENPDEYIGEQFYFFPYTYFDDDVHIRWGKADLLLTLKD